MKHLKYFETVSLDDIIECIDDGNVLYIKAIPKLPEHNPDTPVRPVSITDDGVITIEIDGEYHDALHRNVSKIDRDF
jgi:hypothetical protein